MLAREMDVLMDAGAYAGDTPILTSLALLLAGAVYKVGPTPGSARAVYTNTAPCKERSRTCCRNAAAAR